MTVNPALLKPPSSLLNSDLSFTGSLTPSEWHTIRSSARANFSPTPAGGRRVRFWLIASLMFLMVLCNSITLVKTLRTQKWWMLRFDKAGYLKPNDRLLIPICTFVNCALVLCSIILLEKDYNKYLHRSTMISALVSYNFLFFCAVTKVWKILSVVPIVPVQLRPGSDSLSVTGLSPRLYNMMIVLMYIGFAATTLPFGVTTIQDAANLGKQAFELAPQLNLLIDNYLAKGQTPPPILLAQVRSRLSSVQHLLHVVMVHRRLMSGLYLLFTISLFFVFIYASVRLNLILKVQLRILNQARRRFTRNTSSTLEPCTLKGTEVSNSIQGCKGDCCRFLREWLSREPENELETNNIQDEPENQLGTYEIRDETDCCTKHAEMREKFRVIHRYRKAVGIQVLCICVIFLGFVTLEFCLTLDVLEASTRYSATAMILIKYEWAGWAWSVPGSILSLMTCFMERVPNSSKEETSQTPPRTSFAKPILELKHFPKPGPAHMPEEADIANLRSYRFFLPESPASPEEVTTPNPTGPAGRLLQNMTAPLFQCQPLSSRSGRARNLSWLSIHQCEEITDTRTELRFTDSECGQSCFYHAPSDIDVIKSLRARDSEPNIKSTNEKSN